MPCEEQSPLLNSETTVSHKAVKVCRYRECILAGAAPIPGTMEASHPSPFLSQAKCKRHLNSQKFHCPLEFCSTALDEQSQQTREVPTTFSEALQEAAHPQCETHSWACPPLLPFFQQQHGSIFVVSMVWMHNANVHLSCVTHEFPHSAGTGLKQLYSYLSSFCALLGRSWIQRRGCKEGGSLFHSP